MEILYANMSTKFKQVLEIHQKQLSGCAHAIPVEILRRLNAMYSQVLGAVSYESCFEQIQTTIVRTLHL